jgi:hypothetical protein
MAKQFLFFWCFTVNISGEVGMFVPMVMVIEGMLQVFGSGKAYQQEPLRLKDRTVLPGINHLKNALWSCVVEIHLQITN